MSQLVLLINAMTESNSGVKSFILSYSCQPQCITEESQGGYIENELKKRPQRAAARELGLLPSGLLTLLSHTTQE